MSGCAQALRWRHRATVSYCMLGSNRERDREGTFVNFVQLAQMKREEEERRENRKGKKYPNVNLAIYTGRIKRYESPMPQVSETETEAEN